jgi:putative DNA methylase
MTYRKKLIEVALPLPEINDASAFDKRPGIGPHPKGIHHWWARLPLPTARAVLFAAVVDDPSSHSEKWPTEEGQNAERERLFGILRRMMSKRLHEHPEVYADARAEILKHCDGRVPSVFDPFAGGGSIPLEANRLGFKTYAADLNPVAVLLNRCNLELAPRWLNHSPVNPEDRRSIGGTDPWRGTHALATDVRYYGRLVWERARAKIGHLYPKVRLPNELGGGEVNVIAWIWARTVVSPDPAARGKQVPLVSTYRLSSKRDSEAWLDPVVDRVAGTYRFDVRTGTPKDPEAVRAGTKVGKGFRCLLTDTPIPFDYIRREGRHGRLGSVMLAVVADLSRRRGFVKATGDQVEAAGSATPYGFPESDLPDEALGFRVQNYGIRHHWQMFTPRQLTAMVTLSDLVREIGMDVRHDAAAAGLVDADIEAYARTVMTFLALALSRCADHNNALCRWDQSPAGQRVKQLFGRNAIPMVWDFAEANILGDTSVCWSSAVDITAEGIESLVSFEGAEGVAQQIDATSGIDGLSDLLISTDPPYYDNIGYAALSDFFYVWLRRTMGHLHPDLFGTVLVPRLAELTASPELFAGDKEKAREHFEAGFRRAFTAMRDKMDRRFPLTVYYAFKQDDEESGAEVDGTGRSGVDLTTGWETLLEALIASGFQITGTWPVRASQAWRMRAMGSNALASYIVLACRPRPTDSQQTDRRSLVADLKRELPSALRHLQQGSIAPVDFAQAAIGPGMAVYSRYSRILETTGKAMTVRAALSLINRTLTEVLSDQDDEFDADTRWAIAWFEQQGFADGEFGQAEVLSKAKVTSVAGLQQAGLIRSKGGKVRLLRPDELPAGWDPATDRRLTIWETTHHLIRVLNAGGEVAAAELVAKLGTKAETSRELAYRLYSVCEHKKRAHEALAYNALVQSWPEIIRLAREKGMAQAELFTQGVSALSSPSQRDESP